jgi:D-alanyl-D-alanine endopeptidase (penicillin-binding protein 7)
MKKLLVLLLSVLVATAAPLAEAAAKKQSEQATSTKVVAKSKHHKHAGKRQKKTVAKASRHTSHKHVAHRKHAVKADVTANAPAAVSEPVVARIPVAAPVVSIQPANASPADLKLSQALERTPQSATQETPNTANLDLRSAAVLVVDQKTGKALYAKNPDMQTPIASITKLMTSLVVLEAGQSLSEQITVSDADVDRLKYTTSRLPVGTTLTRAELMHLALIASENRAAAALARSYPGGRDACIKAMNRKAAELGMTHTHYVDGTGLNSGNQSTAADLAKLVNVASGNPTIHQITSTGEYGIDLPGYQMVKIRQHGKTRRVSHEVERRVAFHNTNALTRNPDWEIGLSKTGFINEAGHCLVMQTNIAGRKVIMVLLDSVGKFSRIGDANRVRSWLEGGGRET